MPATDLLSSEHRVIERVVAALDAAADRLDAGEPLRRDFFVDAARFLRDFADGWHHGKEEGVLFPALGEHGMPAHGGPVAVMLYEHERARALTAGLAEAGAKWAAGDDAVADTVADYARSYGELLAGHIYKEDNILFPMADDVLRGPALDAVLAGFGRAERRQAAGDPAGAEGLRASLLALADALVADAGADPARRPPRAFVPPCHAR